MVSNLRTSIFSCMTMPLHTIVVASLAYFVASIRSSTSPSLTSAMRNVDFDLLGNGGCLNRWGQSSSHHRSIDPAHGNQENSSDPIRACQQACAAEAQCNGIEVAPGVCTLMIQENFFPARANDDSNLKCFSAAPYVHKSSPNPTIRIPQILWTYWGRKAYFHEIEKENTLGSVISKMATTGRNATNRLFATAGRGKPDDFVSLCMDVVAKLNPTYEVVALSPDTLKDFVDVHQFPSTFNDMTVQHQSDIIRIELLAHYGGVWMDASTLMLHPFVDMTGTDQLRQVYFTFDRRDIDDARPRIGKMYVENWFLMARPGDQLIAKVKSCFFEAMSVLDWQGFPRQLRETGLFNARQLDILNSLKIDSYLTMHACFFKALDEDVGLRNEFFNVEHTELRHAAEEAFTLQVKTGWDAMRLSQSLVGTQDDALAMELVTEGAMLKLRGDDRKHVNNVGRDELHCGEHTLRKVLDLIGYPGPNCSGYKQHA